MSPRLGFCVNYNPAREEWGGNGKNRPIQTVCSSGCTKTASWSVVFCLPDQYIRCPTDWAANGCLIKSVSMPFARSGFLRRLRKRRQARLMWVQSHCRSALCSPLLGARAGSVSYPQPTRSDGSGGVCFCGGIRCPPSFIHLVVKPFHGPGTRLGPWRLKDQGFDEKGAGAAAGSGGKIFGLCVPVSCCNKGPDAPHL